MYALFLSRMRIPALCLTAVLCLATLPKAFSAVPPACGTGARTFYPCELSFTFEQSGQSPFTDELLTVEFRSPRAITYRLHAFLAVPNTLRVRFTPTESGTWTYRTSSSIPQ